MGCFSSKEDAGGRDTGGGTHNQVSSKASVSPVPGNGSTSEDFILPEKHRGEVASTFNLGKVLGKGQFGTTRVAVRKETGEKFACKTISKRKLVKETDKEDVRQEVAILDHLTGHPHVVTLVGVYEDQRNVHIVMELCTGGELFDRIVHRGHYSEKTAAQIIRAIVEVVAHCHGMGVVHRDLKPENFMLAQSGSTSELKAIDFGLSTFFKPDEKLRDIVGSAYYVAPEVLRKQYSSQCDIWSCGVILYILLCGMPPFFGDNEAAIFRQVLNGNIEFESFPWPRVSPAAKDCVRKMLTRDPSTRATAEQILKHEWLRVNGAASDEPLGNEIQDRLKRFQDLNKLKRQALLLIASYLPPDEVKGLRNTFEALDADKNGTITAEELQKAVQSSDKLPQKAVKELMEGLDLDKSGAIDYNEFLAATLNASKAARDEHIRRAFHEFDTDGSGTISRGELQQALERLGSDTPSDVQDILDKVDKNGDGQIDYEEFVDMMKPPAVQQTRRRSQIKF